ncbi:response regulator [Sphingomonas sabuli]|uniref:histidine kinase n=1 Tax=Sphingomonas sabuli TaxID=2764186 RepID=A0A7G9L050_9SPHN|nr:ATP-binding protein [Sphingomonas sabuli]QNM81999.1 response regulator [Sphingomonas sabuli]
MTPGGDDIRFDWRRGGAAAAGALIAVLLLLSLVYLVASSNQQRDSALNQERRAYDVTLLTRSIDASLSRAEAGLGQFAVDEDVKGSGNVYYSYWRLAGRQMAELRGFVRRDPEQVQRVEELQALYATLGEKFDEAARVITSKQGDYGLGYFYSATRDPAERAIHAKLREIAEAERDTLRERIEQTQVFSARADKLTDYLSWLGILVGIGAIFLGFVAVVAVRQFSFARRLAENETERAEGLEAAVRERTQELWDANQALKAEAAEREAAEAQLRQVQKMEAVGQLTGGIAHDFNNMLAVVVGGVDLARRRLNGPRREVMAHLDNAMEGATRAAALTRRLLSFARSEPLLPDRVEPSQLLAGMTDLLDRTLGERIRITVDAPQDSWPVYVDPHQLENAIVNLAVNARDAMDGVGRLTISAANVRLAANEVGDIRPGEYVRVSVTDTGSGMAPDVIERAFEPFFTTKPVGKGTGLGLSQIFGFAHQSGGEVGIESEVGKGTTVSIYLPRSNVEAPVQLRPATQRMGEEERVAGARILVVEDDPRVRVATVEALQDLDYDPVACDSGEEAIRIFDGRTFDLVISDVIMPEMTGPELIKILKQKRQDFAVLFVTGYVGESESDGLVGHELLRKPFTVGALASAVATALQPSEPPRSSGAVATR